MRPANQQLILVKVKRTNWMAEWFHSVQQFNANNVQACYSRNFACRLRTVGVNFGVSKNS